MAFLVCLAWPDCVGALRLSGGVRCYQHALVAAAYLIPTPVGTTASRLPELFAAPIIVAIATVPLVRGYCSHSGRGPAVTAGIHHRGATAGRSRAQRGVLCAPP